MKFGVREICDVVLKAKARQKIGNKVFYAGEPVCYFDTLKTSSLEGAATTVYANGGRGNARLMSWDGERTVTFTMEDALISPEGLMILSGAGLLEASEKDTLKQHISESVEKSALNSGKGATPEDFDAESVAITIPLSNKPYLPANAGDNFAYVMLKKEGEIVSEPFIPVHTEVEENDEGKYEITILAPKNYRDDDSYGYNGLTEFPDFDSVLVDYYTERKSGMKQINITPDSFGGNYYLEAATLFRDTNGKDMPAEFIIPNCRVQSNFTFTMASSGDPSTFTFTMDAFPDYTKFNKNEKVYSAIQIVEDETDDVAQERRHTWHVDGE